MTKYAPLAAYLSRVSTTEVRLSFSDVESIIGSTLPPVAGRDRRWWATSRTDDTHSHAHLWLAAGWERWELNLDERWIVFRRVVSAEDSATHDPSASEHPKTDDLPGRLVQEAADYGGGGESASHEALKQYVATHPLSIGIEVDVLETIVEYRLPSGDEIDVLFRLPGRCVAVEVKSNISPEKDLARGVFQCIKYEALLKAVSRYEGLTTDVSALLVLSATLTPESRRLASILGVSVVERVGTGIIAPAV